MHANRHHNVIIIISLYSSMNDSRLNLNWLTHSDLPSSRASTKQKQLGLLQSIYFYHLLFHFPVHCFIFNSFSYLPSSSSSSTSSLWIIHWVIHNLGEAARDLHSSLCHWVLFGGIFNNCLIYQIDWELEPGPCVQQCLICLIMSGVSAKYFPTVGDSTWLPGELPTRLQQL